MCVAASIPDLRRRAAPDQSLAGVVQRRPAASGLEVSQPSSVPCTTINRGGLIWRVHYRTSTAAWEPPGSGGYSARKFSHLRVSSYGELTGQDHEDQTTLESREVHMFYGMPPVQGNDSTLLPTSS